MSVLKRGKTYYLRIRPFGELINISTFAVSKSEARNIEMGVLIACRSGDYRSLSAAAREVCVRMFRNQKWEIPADLTGSHSVKKELTLWRAMEIFLNYPEVKQSAEKDRYTMCFAHLVGHFGKDMPVKNIRIPHIKEYMVARTSSGSSPSQVNREKGTLSKMFQVLTELQYVEANPCRLVKNLSQKSEERQVYLSREDVQKIAEKCPDWFQAVIWTSYYSGARRGELVNLRRSQVRLDRRLILLGPEDTKEGHWKRIPIHLNLVPIIEACLKVASLDTDRVFLIHSKHGSQAPTLEAFKNPWPRACEALEKAELLKKPFPRFHDLRHTWRANARRSGIDPAIAESILGHWFRGRTVNERYGRIGDAELLQALDSMSFDHGSSEILVARGQS